MRGCVWLCPDSDAADAVRSQWAAGPERRPARVRRSTWYFRGVNRGRDRGTVSGPWKVGEIGLLVSIGEGSRDCVVPRAVAARGRPARTVPRYPEI